MNTLIEKARLYLWGGLQIAQLGRPDIALGFLGGIGDDLLCTAPIEEWRRRGAQCVWFFSRHPELFPHFDRQVRLVREDARLQRLALRLGQPMRALSYSTYDPAADRDSPLSEHLIAAMCRRAGLTGRVSLRPHLPLSAKEHAWAARWSDCVAIQTSSLTASAPMQNKQWPAARFQAAVDHLTARGMHCVQVGSPADAALRGATDLRGRTSLRETAMVLARTRLFVGLAGFLMHLARAVECPGVIIYGGREPPELTGYICNINVTDRPACAPCWQRNRCDFSHACMEDITAQQVISALDDACGRPRGPLAVEEIEL